MTPVAIDRVLARGVTKVYGRQRALGGVDLELRAGSCCALLGANGAGKSTLLSILSTLLRPTSGELTFEAGGRRLPPEEIRGAIGLLAHEPLVYGDLTARENLRLFAALHDVPDPASRAAHLLDQVGLSPESRARPARTFSRGMLQRLALARALLHEPSLLLLDEPFTGLDAGGRDALAAALTAQRAIGRILVIATHDLEAVAGLCDHAVVLARGRIAVERHAGLFAADELRELARTQAG